MTLQIKDREVIKRIADNYIELEKSIVTQLKLSCDHHHVTSGSFREEIWKALFRQIIPKKFTIERSVFIIDSEGRVSKEVDLAVFDEQYTPYIFNYGNIKYIPIEAVAVVVQCKSRELKNKEIQDWVKSITSLETSLKSVARMHSYIASGEFDCEVDDKGFLNNPKHSMSQTSTRPIRILCHLDEKFTTRRKKITDLFDIILYPKQGRLKTHIIPEQSTLDHWLTALNHVNDKYKNLRKTLEESKAGNLTLDKYRVYDNNERGHDISLLTLTFQLNQLLMLVNNPLLFPHLAYVEMFQKELINQ